MSGVISANTFEQDLNNIVKEYLEFGGFEKTSSVFLEECKEQGKLTPKSSTSNKENTQLQAAQREMLHHYRHGNKEEFFHLWTDNLPEKMRNEESVAQKLEFYLHIYFAIYPIGTGSKEECEVAMQGFRQYLETRGSSLSQTTEFLPFYALPYVPNPRNHPTYRELFEEHWIPNLELRLTRYLGLALQASSQPRLVELYKGAGQRDAVLMKQIQTQIVESERRAMQHLRRHNRVQADYHNLIGITAELVDALESTLQGRPISSDYLQQICVRLFATQQVKQSVDLSRPGTAAQALRQTIKAAPQQGVQDQRAKTERDNYARLCNLDFEHVKADLVNSDDVRKCFLLQALRWRLTKSPVDQREQALSGYISNDLLGCTNPGGPHHQAVLGLLSATNPTLRQYAARLFNTVASLCRGRTYLSQNTATLNVLIQVLQQETRESITRDNIIGALQKLSLRRPMQTAMVNGGVMEWLVSLLEDIDSLSDYTLEYTVALFMNLCLRTAGKKRCVDQVNKILKVLTDLMGHENKEIMPYVNGALYSILAIPAIREEAKAMDLEGILKCFIKENQPDMNRQFEFIIRQLNSNDEPGVQESSDEEDDDDEEDQDALEPDLDKSEELHGGGGQLVGEVLLSREYASLSPGGVKGRQQPQQSGREQAWEDDWGRREEPLTRPVTPGQRTGRTGGLALGEATGHDRPPTRSGSRPSSAAAGAPGGNKSSAPSTPQTAQKQQQRKPSQPAHPEYNKAFSSRPKIPRTPEVSGGGGGDRTPPKPMYSDGVPTPRPNSGGRLNSAGHNQSRAAAGGASKK